MSRHGFTMTELLVVLSITSTIAGAVGLLYLEVRVAGTLTESQVALERRAALVLEWVGRDVRGARSVDSGDDEVVIRRPQGPVTYRITEGRLVRDDGRSRRTLTRYARRLSVLPTEGGHRAEVALGRRLLRGRQLRLTRQTFVGGRR